MKEMFMMMIRNSYNKKDINKTEEGIKELEAIKKFIELLPMKYVIEGKISMSDLERLEYLIDTNIKMMESE